MSVIQISIHNIAASKSVSREINTNALPAFVPLKAKIYVHLLSSNLTQTFGKPGLQALLSLRYCKRYSPSPLFSLPLLRLPLYKVVEAT
jgi:hypothetical protein